MSPRERADQDLAAALRALRKRGRRSQEALAHDAGVTVAALARVERGQTNPSWTTVRRIVKALDMTLVQLARAIEKQGGD